VSELIEHARVNPGKLKHGDAGIGAGLAARLRINAGKRLS